MNYFDFHRHTIPGDGYISAIVNLFPEEAVTAEARKRVGIFFSMGLHPWKINPISLEVDIAKVAKFAASQDCAAVGESGLDRLCDTPFDLQIQVFERHVVLAESVGKPLVIHCVRAFPELISLKKKLNPSHPWIIHYFRSNIQTAKELLRHGLHLSFGPALRNSQKLRDVLAEMPPERIFLETDEFESEISDVYAIAAECRKTEMDALKFQMSENARKTLGIAVF